MEKRILQILRGINVDPELFNKYLRSNLEQEWEILKLTGDVRSFEERREAHDLLYNLEILQSKIEVGLCRERLSEG